MKEVVSDLKTLAYKGCKIAAQKKYGFSANFALLAWFFGIGATIRIGREIFFSRMRDFQRERQLLDASRISQLGSFNSIALRELSAS